MNYPDSVQFLYALGNEIKTAKFGLERIRAVLEALGNPETKLRFVHVAGTNGKGSTCAMIESGLRAAGRRTGLFTSPHLAEPTERIRIDGEPVSAARFADAFNRVHATVESMLDAGAIDCHTTYFETVTAMAMLIFADERPDLPVVLEVGLGGRLDATNIVNPELCVITPIDFDHEAYLGKSIESIAGEKAGILKVGTPAVFARQRSEAAAVLNRRAAELAVPASRSEDWAVSELQLDARGSRFLLSEEREPRASGAPGSRPPAPDPQSERLRIRCQLPGEHQVENAKIAAIALTRLGVPDDAIIQGIARAKWPGRLERVSERPEIILDGAHNPAGARALAAYIARFYGKRRVRLIFGAMRDKSVEEIAAVLFPLAQEVIVTAPRQARAIAPETLREIAAHPNLRVAPVIEDALKMVEDAGADDVIFVSGSLFLVAEARAIIGAKR
jgi:dihydrofolate synthase/folylpolyglutamate synthase